MSGLHYGIAQPLRIYENIEHQNRNRRGNTNVFKLLCPTTRLLPFQISRPPSAAQIISILLIDRADNSSTDILADIHMDDLKIYKFSSYDQIVHFGINNIDSNFDVGEYYLEISDGFKTWYSEDLKIVDFDPDSLDTNCVLSKFEYWNTCDIGGIFYRTVSEGHPQYKNVFYLDTSIGVPSYEYEEEGEEDSKKVFYADFQKMEKFYNIQSVFPEFMVDALALLPLHVNRNGGVDVYTHLGYSGTVSKITSEPEWQGSFGAFAKVDIDFAVEFASSSNCCDALEPVSDACITTQRTAKDFLSEGGTLYNANQYESVELPTVRDLVSGDFVLVADNAINGIIRLKQFDGTNYLSLMETSWGGEDVTVLHALESGSPLTSTYYFNGGSGLGWINTPSLPVINDAGANMFYLRGKCWNNCTVQIYSKVTGGGESLTTQITGEQFTSGHVVQFPAGANEFRVDFIGATCVLAELPFQTIATVPLRGIGYMQIGNNQTNPFKVR